VIVRSRVLGVLPLSLWAITSLGLALTAPLARAAAPGPPQDSTSPNVGQPFRGSSPEQQALSAFLRARGFTFYGAWWCPACFKQKNLFGQEAGNQLPYVECDKQPQQRERCQAAGIQAYPTWVLGNERREGVLTLEELKSWSGFQGVGRPGVSAPRPATGATPPIANP
jgi:glutaredoxin